MSLRIRDIRCRAVAAPMKRPLATSTGKLTEAALLLIDLQTEEGIVGRSYLFGIGKHNLAPIAKLVEAMAAMLKNDPVTPFEIEKKLRARYTLLGVHNIVLFALSGIDMAAWDALGQSLGQPLVRLLGGAPRPVPAYNSKGLGLLPLKELAQEATDLVDEGFRAVKLRVGRRDGEGRPRSAAHREEDDRPGCDADGGFQPGALRRRGDRARPHDRRRRRRAVDRGAGARG